MQNFQKILIDDNSWFIGGIDAYGMNHLCCSQNTSKWRLPQIEVPTARIHNSIKTFLRGYFTTIIAGKVYLLLLKGSYIYDVHMEEG